MVPDAIKVVIHCVDIIPQFSNMLQLPTIKSLNPQLTNTRMSSNGCYNRYITLIKGSCAYYFCAFQYFSFFLSIFFSLPLLSGRLFLLFSLLYCVSSFSSGYPVLPSFPGGNDEEPRLPLPRSYLVLPCSPRFVPSPRLIISALIGSEEFRVG